MCGAWPPNEAHHRTGAGMGLKHNDRDTMSLCFKDHRDLHALAGRFKGWTKEQVRTWQQRMILKTMKALTS